MDRRRNAGLIRPSPSIIPAECQYRTDWFLFAFQVARFCDGLTTPVTSLKEGGEPEGYGCTDRDITRPSHVLRSGQPKGTVPLLAANLVGKINKRRRLAGSGRTAGSGRLAGSSRTARRRRVSGRGRIAAPLLGGVRGWVYFHKTPYLGIAAKSFPEITLMQVRCYTDSRYTVNDFRSWSTISVRGQRFPFVVNDFRYGVAVNLG
jgi:hypothetical protein